MKFGSLLLCLLGLFAQTSRGQGSLDRAFLQWLSQMNFLHEAHDYLYDAGMQESDSLYAWRAMLALQQNDRAGFETSWMKGQSFLKKEPLLCGRISCSLLKEEKYVSLGEAWFSWLAANTQEAILIDLVSVYKTQLDTKNSVLQQGQIALDWKKYQQAQRKKSGLAALSSAIVPGSGAWYVKAPGRGISQTIFIGLLSMQAYESVHRVGWKHPLTWFTVPVAGLFYMAGIYGSARDMVQYREAMKRTLFHDVSDYYSAVYYSRYF